MKVKSIQDCRPRRRRPATDRPGALDIQEKPKLANAEVDDGANMKPAGHSGLRGFPTVLLFIDGAIKGCIEGHALNTV